MIRLYDESDLEAIIEIWYQASRIAHSFLSEAFLEKEERNIRNIYIKAAETWIHEEDGTVLGFLSLIGNEVGAIFV